MNKHLYIAQSLYTTTEGIKKINYNELKAYMEQEYKNKCNSYEIIKEKTFCKIIIDLDNKIDRITKQRKNKPLTNSFINNFITDFKDYINTFKKIAKTDIKHLIKLSLTPSEANENINEIELNSVHLIFNLKTDNFKNIKSLLIDFLKCYTIYEPYTDLKIYTRNRKMRLIGSKKEDKYRNDYFYPLINGEIKKWTELSNEELLNYMITYTDNNDISINIKGQSPSQIHLINNKIIHNEEEEEEEEDIWNWNTLNRETLTNIKYENNCDYNTFKQECLKNLKYMDTDTFFCNLFSLIQIIRQDNEPNHNKELLIKTFLDIERSEKYKNCYENDKAIINDNLNTLHKNTNNKYFIQLTSNEINFIKKHIQQDIPQPQITFIVNKIKDKKYILNIKNTNIYYDTHNKILIKNGLIKTIITENKNPEKKNKTYKKKLFKNTNSQEINYFIEKNIIEYNNNNNFKSIYNINEITEWNEIKESDKNEYNWGAVGSKKSYERMRNDIIYTLIGEDNKIIFVGDTRALCNKHYGDIRLILKCEGYDDKEIDKLIHHYSNKKLINEKCKIYITTYDSILLIHTSLILLIFLLTSSIM